MHPWGRRVHPGSLDTLGCALGVVGFIRGSLRCALGFVGSSNVCLVHWGSPWGSSVSSGVAWLVSVRPWSRHSVHWECALGVVLFIRVHWGAPFGSSGSSGITGFIEVRPWGRWVLLGTRPWGRRVHRGH